MASQKTTVIFVLCMTCQTLIAIPLNVGTTQAINDEISDKDVSSSTDSSGSLSSEIRSLIGKTMNFSHFSSFTEGVQLTLNETPINLSAFTVDKHNAEILSKMLRGRNVTELFYVACKLAKIEAREAALENETVMSLAMEDIFDPSNDVVLRIRDVTDLNHSTVSPDRTKRKAKRSGYYWSTTIPYNISSDFDNDPRYIQAIRDGIQNWADETCLEFKQLANDSNYEDSHIVFRKLDGCYSSIGRLYGSQVISIGKYCGWKEIVAHEVGHALGFDHEQSRPDRDLYVKILTKNIKPGHGHNFVKNNWREFMTAGIPYDYSSIMHYGLNDFGKNNSRTIQLLEDDMDRVVDAAIYLSFYDVKLANYIYCADRCNEGLAWSACQNDGYRDPKNCSRCKCPDGWTGQYCTEVKPGVNAECGSTELLATKTWQTLKSPGYDTSGYPVHSECTWRIKAPFKHNIVVKSAGKFYIPASRWRRPCYDYIEVRSKDMARAGPRFCGRSFPNESIVSQGNQILLLMRTTVLFPARGFHLEYKMEPCGCSTDHSVLTVPPCVKTVRVQCNKTYEDCTTGLLCVKKLRNNTCYKETRECCDGFELRGDDCYPTEIWSEWSGLSTCTRTCGTGYRYRFRECTGTPCSGPKFETWTCNTIGCPGAWSVWNTWTDCSKSCGSGTRTRNRDCLTPHCSGYFSENQTCNTNSCPGVWSDWSSWTGCTKTCGVGFILRRRSCLTQSCRGDMYDVLTCNNGGCSGVWSDWSNWTGCTKTCGIGFILRRRSCLTQSCRGDMYDVLTCNNGGCSGVWSDWSNWTGCTKTCGIGFILRRRSCLTQSCRGDMYDVSTCDNGGCSGGPR